MQACSYSLTGKILNGTLPLRLLKLQGEISGDKHKLSWVIDADEQVTSQVLEVSADGISFTPVVTADAASRTYTYKPFVSTTAIYRLSVTFDNGKHYYSNMVTLRNTGTNDIPKLVTNVIGTENIRVSSPGNFDYAVFDLNGRPVAKGRLTSGINNISGAALSVGMYIIRYSNAGEQWTDKLIRH